MSFKFFATILVASALCAFSTPVAVEQTLIGKRFSGQGTWFDVGRGNCGRSSNNNGFSVALSNRNYDDGKHCGSKIEITSNGKTAIAIVEDSCPSCSFGDLDMSPALFEHFAVGGLGVGVIHVLWHYA